MSISCRDPVNLPNPTFLNINLTKTMKTWLVVWKSLKRLQCYMYYLRFFLEAENKFMFDVNFPS